MSAARLSSEINKRGKREPYSRLANKIRIFSGLVILWLISTMALPLAMHLFVKEVQAADEIGWFVHTVDDEGHSIFHTSLAFDPSGNPAISYHDDADGTLKYAHWNGLSWDIQTVDAGYTGQFTSLVFDTSGNPAIAYRSYYLAHVLKYAHWNGSSWDIQTVDIGQIQYVSLALDPSGNPGIVYSDMSTDELKYAHWNELSWDIQTVASKESCATDYGSLAFDEEGNPAIASGGARIQYAHWNGSSWDIHHIPPGSSGNKFFTSLALDSSGNPFISYYDGDGNDLKCLHWDGSAWDIQTVDDASSSVGYYISSLTLDTSGNPAIAYNGNGGLKYAIWDGTSWHTQMVDSGDIGYFASLKFDGSGNPAISYIAKGDLRFASTMPMGSPNKPDNLSPTNGATNVGLPVTLRSSTFSDPTIGDTHIASQWQVTYVPGDYSNPIFDSGRDTVNLTQITLPPQTLTYVITYYWHVRYQDRYGSWSSYSSDTRFTTTNYAPPSANFTATPTDINEGETVIFTDLSSGYITSWLWDLGDGTVVTWTLDTKPKEGKLEHVYATKGCYTITLTVSTLGGKDIETKEDYISVSKLLIQGNITFDGGKVEIEDKRIVIDFPVDAVDGTAIIIIKEEPEIPTGTGGFKAGNTYFTVQILSADGTLLTTLAKDVTMTVRYSDDDVAAAGGKPQLLTLSRYNEDSGKWVSFPTTVDTNAKTLSATTNQFSKWMVMVEESRTGFSFWVWIVAGAVIALIVVIIVRHHFAQRSIL